MQLEMWFISVKILKFPWDVSSLGTFMVSDIAGSLIALRH